MFLISAGYFFMLPYRFHLSNQYNKKKSPFRGTQITGYIVTPAVRSTKGIELLKLLNDWLLHHIMDVDMQDVKPVRKAGIK